MGATCEVEEVNILGKWYRIEQDDLNMEINGCNGETMADKCLIRYTGNQDIQQLRDTIWHEIKHAIYHETALATDFKDDKVDLTEEQIILRSAPAELQVMRDNEGLMEFLLDD